MQRPYGKKLSPGLEATKNLKNAKIILKQQYENFKVAMLTMRLKRFIKKTGRNLNFNGKEIVGFDKTKCKCYNYHMRGHFARECKVPKSQGHRNGNNTRRVVPVKTPANVLVVTDRMGYYWSYQAEERPTDFAPIAFSSSGSSSSDTKTGLGYDSQLNERDLNNKSDVFESASDSSVNESEEDNNQANDRYKTGEGYHAVPLPYNGNFMPPRPDLSFARLDDSVFKSAISETVTSCGVITNSSKVPVNAAKQSSSRAAASTSTARYVNTAVTRPTVNGAKPSSNIFHKSHLLVRRTFNQRTTPKNSDLKETVNIVKVNNVTTAGTKAVVSVVQGNRENDVKSSACCIWRPTRNVIDHISKDSGSYMLKRFTYVDLQGRLKHMTVNKSFLIDYQEIDGGFVAFRESPKGERKATQSLLVLVTKPHHKTPYELLIGRSPNLDFMKPFGCPVTILNTLDHLGKFKGKADEEFLVRCSVNSKALRVFNSRTRRVKENLHIKFLENKPNVTGRGPEWLFDIDSLTTSMHYEPVIAGNQTNNDAGIEINVNAGKAGQKKASVHEYILLSFMPSSTQSSDDKDADGVPDTGDEGIDVKIAFLYGTIEEEVYVCQPPGFEDPHFPNKMMHKRFQMSSMGELTFFLGLQVKQKDDGIFINQDKYVADILIRFDFTTMKKAITLMEPNKALIKDGKAKNVYVHLYRLMIGSLMYLTASRPDIMFAISACTRFQVTPKTSHLHVVKRIFRYLKGQPKLGLWYPRDSPFDLEAFSNSDYARASLDRKSIT
nr:uncharacterized mitochondrial protein AtMg00810-like [Tanacetum cinerariifolium]